MKNIFLLSKISQKYKCWGTGVQIEQLEGRLKEI